MLNDFDASLLSSFGEPVTFADLRLANHRGPDKDPGVYALRNTCCAHAVIPPLEQQPMGRRRLPWP